MPALKATAFAGEIAWLGTVADRATSLRSRRVGRVEATFEGLAGEAHGGILRASCSRVADLYSRGTPIRNVRQVTILAEEDLRDIAAALGLRCLDPAPLGAQMVLRDLPDLTHLPPSSRLQGPSGATLVVDMQNLPCALPAREIEAERPGHGRAFQTAARGRRGVTAWVEREGPIAVGDALQLYVPDQPAWAHAGTALSG